MPPKWLEVNWLLASFSKRKKKACKAYSKFVADGKNQPDPWKELRNQVYLGSDQFVEKMVALIDDGKELSEVPSSQRRLKPRTLSEYEVVADNRNNAIELSYASGGYTLKEIGDYFGLH